MAKLSRNDLREGRHAHVRKKVAGSGERPRLNVFRSLDQIYAQVIDDERGVTLAAASTIDHELRASIGDLDRMDQARAVGRLVAQRAQSKGVTKVVFDRGGYRFIGRVKALADGAREAGLEF
jgi:large subunit ribosomal protein L18